jgi:hypothetical protein
MYSTTKTVKTISLIGAFVLTAATARAVSPPPDGGYPNFNTAEGEDALFSAYEAGDNTAIGYHALYSSQGWENTAVGAAALQNNTSGEGNTAVGSFALPSNTTAGANTAIGMNALFSNTTGQSNTAVGFETLVLNGTGQSNTAMGPGALYLNTGGSSNTAIGVNALTVNNADNNTALGVKALWNNETGVANTATGVLALSNNTGGSYNAAEGQGALFSNTTGNNNTADGLDALFYNTTGSNNIALGSEAGENLTTGSNNIAIGNLGVAGESNRIRIGTRHTHRATFIAGISGATVPTGVPVIIDPTGHLGTTTSSARFKEAIKPMARASETILALQPVTFRYKHELDPEDNQQFGLVAEEVAKVNPDLVARDEEGKPYTVRYEAVNAMLLNEFLKEHRKVEEQDAAIGQLKSVVAKQQEQITALASQIKTVSSRLELNQVTPRVAASEP